jgi:hypothetical protein
MLVLTAAVALLTADCSRDTGTVTVTVSREELQQRVDERFPIEYDRLLARVTLTNPEVILEPGRDHIGLDMDVAVQVPVSGRMSGGLRVQAGLSYRREEKAFYLRDLSIERLQVEGMDGEWPAKVVRPIELAASKALTVFPVYTLKRRNIRELTAEHVLRSVAVRDGGLHVELGIPLP